MWMKSVRSIIFRWNLIPVFFFLMPLFSMGQYRFEGKVVDAETELPVPTFKIRVDTIDFHFTDGTFKFETAQLPSHITISSKDYYPFSLPVSSGKSNISIPLLPQIMNIQEVIVKAFQSNKRLLDTPGSIGLITNRQLLNEPTYTLALSVNKIPGVWMQTGSINTNRLTIRGIGTRSPYGTNKIRAYYGDIPLTNGIGETTLEDLDLDQIADIEIIKGPSSGFYGSGLGGMLLFNPLKPLKSLFGQQVSIGSFHTIKYTAKMVIANPNSGHSLVYNDLHSDGYRLNNQTNRQNLTWTSNVTKNNTKIDLLAAYIKMDAYIPSSIDMKTYLTTPEKAASNWAATRGYEDYSTLFGGISAEQTMSKNWIAKISTFGQDHNNNELRPFNILHEKTHYLGFRSVMEKKHTSANTTTRLMLGDEFFSENYQWQTLQNNSRVAGELLSDNQEYRRYNNLFLLADLNIQNKYLISASLNWNETNYTYEDHFLVDGDQSGKHAFNPILSPRIAVTRIVSEKVRLFLVISQGFSPPTLEETLMPGGQINKSIKPETGWNFELGTKASVGKSLFLELSAYYMKIKNLLVARRTAEDAYLGINAGATNHPGVEFILDYRLIDRPKWSTNFHMNANLTRYRFAKFVDNGNNYSGNKLTGTPSSTTNWILETTHANGFFLKLHYQTVGRMPILDNNTLYSKAYQLANFMGGYEKSYRNLTVSLSSGIQNLFDTRYASMIQINALAIGTQAPRYYYPGLPRNYKATISLKYSF